MERLAQHIAQALSQVLPQKVEPKDLETPPQPEQGDFAFPCFKLAQILKQAPPQIAQDLAQKVIAEGSLQKSYDLEIKTAGPYLNFKLSTAAAARLILPSILSGQDREGFSPLPLGDYGKSTPQNRGTWVMEYSSPNVAKPFQIYHLRGTVLGAALRRIARYRGYKVIGINHLGDWGSQFGMQSVAMDRYADQLPDNPNIMDLVQLYVKLHQEAAENPELAEQGRQAFVQLEKGEAHVTAQWKKCIEISLKEFKRIYARIGVDFDHYWGESKYLESIPAMLEEFRQSGLLQESEGAQVVHVTDKKNKELPPAIMVKKDGATIYATRDVAAARYRHERFKFDRMTYIVGQEQKLHFQQVFDVLRQAKHDWWKNCEHIATGLYRFKDQKMSTRKGNFVTLEDVLSQAKEKVSAVIQNRSQDLSDEEKEDLVEKVALGAIIYNDLATDPGRDVQFDLDSMLDFDGETGPYLQYAHTRCLSILRKARHSGELKDVQTVPFDPVLMDKCYQNSAEARLIKQLGQLAHHLERVLNKGQASQLSHYLIQLVKSFGSFYHDCPVLGQEPEITQSRLILVDATRRVLGRGLQLLGIPLPERM